MRFVDRMEEHRLRAERHALQAPPGERRRKRLESRRQREAKRDEQVAEQRARLTPADRALAATYRLPLAREDRVRDAQALACAPGERRRTQREVAAIMGVTPGAVAFWKKFPDAYDAHAYDRDKSHRPAPRSPPKSAPEPCEDVATWIRRMRRAVGLTQRKLAEEIGVHRTSVQNWERGESVPGPSNLIALRRVFTR